MPLSIHAWAATAPASSGGSDAWPSPCLAPNRRRGDGTGAWASPPPRQPVGVGRTRTERCQGLGGGHGAPERVRPAARQAAEQTGQGQRIGDALVGRRQELERRILPAEASGRLGDGVRQRAGAGTEGGECRRGGQARVAQGEVERVHPGLRVGEEPGGLGQREAGKQAVADRGGGGRDPCVEPGQRVGGIGQRGEQHRQVRPREPIAVTGWGWAPTPRQSGFVGEVRPGRPELLVRGVLVVERRVGDHSGISPSTCFLWVTIPDPRRSGHDRFVTSGVSPGGERRSGKVGVIRGFTT